MPWCPQCETKTGVFVIRPIQLYFEEDMDINSIPLTDLDEVPHYEEASCSDCNFTAPLGDFVKKESKRKKKS